MKLSLQNFGLSALVIAAMATSSCKKETITPTPAPVLTNEQFESSRMDYIEVYGFVTEAATIGSISYKNESSTVVNDCVVVTVDTQSTTKSVTIDFGSGCTGEDGKVRTGKIYATSSSLDLSATGSVLNVSFIDYTVDGDTVAGGMVLTNNGPGANYTLEGTLDVNSNITYEGNGGNLHGNYHYVLRWSDMNTPSYNDDDAFLFSGVGSGYTTGGRTFTQQIHNPLIIRRAPGCDFFVFGVVDVDIAGEGTRKVNYGDGTCDNIATLTQNGITQTITLR